MNKRIHVLVGVSDGKPVLIAGPKFDGYDELKKIMDGILDNCGEYTSGKTKKTFEKVWLDDVTRMPLKARSCPSKAAVGVVSQEETETPAEG